jgi:hypothetical protein
LNRKRIVEKLYDYFLPFPGMLFDDSPGQWRVYSFRKKQGSTAGIEFSIRVPLTNIAKEEHSIPPNKGKAILRFLENCQIYLLPLTRTSCTHHSTSTGSQSSTIILLIEIMFIKLSLDDIENGTFRTPKCLHKEAQ